MEKLLYPGLRAEMAKRGDTYKTLGKLIKRSESSVSKRFSGKSEWSIGEIEAICKLYDKDYYELFK